MRASGLDDAIAVAAPIVADVRERGDKALLEWTERFDGPRPDGFLVSPERIALASVDVEAAEALVRSEAYAPEHLELLVAEPETLLAGVRNAGSVFVGTSAALQARGVETAA